MSRINNLYTYLITNNAAGVDREWLDGYIEFTSEVERIRASLNQTQDITQGRREIPFHVAFLMVPERGETPEAEWPAVFQNRFKKSVETFVRTLSDSLLQTVKQRNQAEYEFSRALS
jgi:hypothetical protein